MSARLKMKSLPPWRSLRFADAEIRLAEVLSGWEGTHYMAGQSKKQCYADCVGFLIGVGSELTGRDIIRACFPQDLAFHDKHSAVAGMKRIMRAFPEWEKIKVPSILMPGDVLAVGPRGGGPGHAVFVSPWESVLMHATHSAGVHRTGWGLFDGYQELHAVYRCFEPQSWTL